MTPLKSRLDKLERHHTDDVDNFCDYWPTHEQQVDWLAFRLVCLDLYAMVPTDGDEREKKILAVTKEVLDVPWRRLKPSSCPREGIERLKGGKNCETKDAQTETIFDNAHGFAEHYLEQEI